MSELATTGLLSEKIPCYEFWKKLDYCKKNNHYPLEQCKEEAKFFDDCTFNRNGNAELISKIKLIRKRNDELLAEERKQFKGKWIEHIISNIKFYFI